MGCSLATSLVETIKKMKRRHNPEFLFVEPSEMVVTRELQDVAAMGRRDVRYQVGPLITLVDAPRFSFMWAERQQLILGQIFGADVVALSRTDKIEDMTASEICEVLHPHFNGIRSLNINDSASLEAMMDNVPEFTEI